MGVERRVSTLLQNSFDRAWYVFHWQRWHNPTWTISNNKVETTMSTNMSNPKTCQGHFLPWIPVRKHRQSSIHLRVNPMAMRQRRCQALTILLRNYLRQLWSSILYPRPVRKIILKREIPVVTGKNLIHVSTHKTLHSA
jgi:hypothetical protein